MQKMVLAVAAAVVVSAGLHAEQPDVKGWQVGSWTAAVSFSFRTSGLMKVSVGEEQL
jgi:hypothetical protein